MILQDLEKLEFDRHRNKFNLSKDECCRYFSRGASIIKEADKGGTLVVSSTSDYLKEVEC